MNIPASAPILAEALLERSLKKTFAQRNIRMTELSRQHVYSLLYIYKRMSRDSVTRIRKLCVVL